VSNNAIELQVAQAVIEVAFEGRDMVESIQQAVEFRHLSSSARNVNRPCGTASASYGFKRRHAGAGTEVKATLARLLRQRVDELRSVRRNRRKNKIIPQLPGVHLR
jgi:hypothetical protein